MRPLETFADRRAAGRALAELVTPARGSGALVVAIPRGGAAVGDEVARALDAPLELLVTRRLYSPRDPQVVLGAVAETGAVWLNERALMHAGIAPSELTEPITRETLEVQRLARLYRDGGLRLSVEDRPVVLVDDGLVTAATAHAAILALRTLRAHPIVLAVPVADAEAAEALRGSIDALVAVHRPAEVGSLDRWYDDFRPVSDGEVIETLRRRSAEVVAALDAAVP